MIRKSLAAVMLLMTVVLTVGAKPKAPTYKNPKAPIEDRVEDLLSRMTLHEKVLQMKDISVTDFNDHHRMFDGFSYGSCHEMGKDAYECARIHRDVWHYLADSTRLGIPVITSVEGIQGILQNGCTLFPHALAQSATWNTELIERMTDACGPERTARRG